MSRGIGWVQAVKEMLRKELELSENVLREEDSGSSCQDVTVQRYGKTLIISFNAMVPQGSHAKAICIKDRLFPLFREQTGVPRMCDYWILCEPGGERPAYLFLCELKSGRPGGVAQIENAKLLADYFLSMVRHHTAAELGDVEIRGLVFSPANRSPKAGLRPGTKMPYRSLGGRLEILGLYLNDRAGCQLTALCA